MADQEPQFRQQKTSPWNPCAGRGPAPTSTSSSCWPWALSDPIVSFAVAPLKGHKIQALNYLDGIINRRGPVQWVELVMSFMVLAMIIQDKSAKPELNVIATAVIWI